MGILNVTPDSFSDGGRFLDPEAAAARAFEMEAEGADLIDVGGESTRPGAEPVEARQELLRVLPVLKHLTGRLKIPISIDTAKAAVAREALENGAGLVNDVTALGDPRMPEVVAWAKVPVILMHMQGTPRTMQEHPAYGDLIQEICGFLRQAADRAQSSGISRERILIDPGIGFGKSPQHNLEILRRLAEFKALGYPVVVGPSRKSFIGQVLGLPVAERLFGTAACVAMAVAGGADVIRVHDVAPMRQVMTMTQALLKDS